jgi:L,D-transpeptidase YcbB
MPGVRLSGFLASTAVALLLSTAAGTAFAQFATTPDPDATAPAPDSLTTTPAAAGQPDKAGTNPTPASATPAAAAAPPATASPADSATQPQLASPAASSTPSTQPETPAAATNPAAPAGQPQTPAAAATPGATPDSTGNVGGPETPTPAAATATPAAPPTLDAQVADQLRQLSSGKFDRILGGKTERTAIEAFYSGRSYAALWITDGQANDRAKTAIAYLGHVDADGLDPADYPVPDLKSVTDPGALAEAELRFTVSVLTYARHASTGRVAWSRASADIGYDQKAPEAASILAAVADATDVGAALDSYEPHAPGYVALKEKLAESRAGKVDGGKPPIPSGPVLKVGSQDDRVPQLRERLGVPGDGGTVYDKALADAIKQFQKEHDLKPTGTLTAATIDEINGPRPAHETDTILANMERWRWMPHDLGKTYVIVNLPDYTLRVIRDGEQVWKTKIVIGKPAMPTPIMSAEMKFITINPTWNVPPSIVNNEYLPALQQDPTVMERMGLKVAHNPDGTIHIWQPPGDANALGRIRFNFPNKFLVYQHDTPDKYLFAYAKRAYSHGCMRVFDPPKYAEVLLSLVRPGDGYTTDRIKRMYGPNEVNIDFPTFIPVHLTYQTAFVDDDGKLQFREDVYGRDKQVLALLNGPERKVADVPVEHKIDIKHRQVLAIPDQPGLWGGGGGGGGGFFSRLFGGSTAPQRPVPPRPVAQGRRQTRDRETYDR